MSSQRIKALQTVLKQQADNCVALTYSLDLPFFEYMLFEPLYNGGCRNITVLCHPRQYETALEDVPAVRHLGQRYLCLPATIAKAAFHSKLIFLTSKDAGLLLVGSGNVSRSGLTHNQEVWTRFAYTEHAPDESARAACRWAFDYLSRLSEAQQDPMLEQRLEQLWQTTGWLRQEPLLSEGQGYWLLHNLDLAILDQISDRWAEYDGSPVQEAVVVSPYFDKRSLAFEALLKRTRPKSITLITEPEAPGLDPENLRRLLHDAEVSLSSQRLELESRRLHAKFLALRTKRGSWVLTGSPNFSRPAMLSPVQEGNAETAVLRYEPGPNYVDSVMVPISEKAVPMELDWPVSWEELDGTSDEERPSYRLLRAEVIDRRLSILVEPEVPENAQLCVELIGQEAKSFEVDRWERDGENIVLELSEGVSQLLASPATLKLMINSPGVREFSTRTIVNNSPVLKASSRPVHRQEHTVVSERLVSEDFERDIELLSRLQNLLAMNPQQLREHRGISKQSTEELRREDAIAVDEEYDPEAMIVDEQSRRIEIRTGSDLYVDFYQRAFYEDVLAAARAAVYRPISETTQDQSTSRQDGATSTTDKAAKEKVTRQFTRLVKNFEKGMQDSEYLTQAPPTYIRELFFILTTFLRSLWWQERVNDANFFNLSERLFSAFLGDERESTGWSVISHGASEEQLRRDDSQPHFIEQSWLHLHLLADYALAENEERLPELARLLRIATYKLSPPTILAELPFNTLAAMWRSNFSRDQVVPSTHMLVRNLIEYSQWYNEETLRQELKRSLGVRVGIERRGGWGLAAVPTMQIEGAWSDEHIDAFWRAFTKFCQWPRWKKNPRLEVYDSNPMLTRYDTKRLVLFYREDNHRLTVLVDPDDDRFDRKEVINNAYLRDLCELQHLSDVG